MKHIIEYIRNTFIYFLNHWQRFLIIFIVFFFSCLAFSIFSIKENVLNENGAIIEQNIIISGITLSNWGTFISIIAVSITALWAIYQFDKSVARKQQERGAEIAKLFSDELLLKCDIINRVYIETPFKKILAIKNTNYDSLINFDVSELRHIYRNDNFPTFYRNVEESCNYDNIYYTFLEKRITLDGTVDFSKIKDYSVEEARELFKSANTIFPFRFCSLVD